MVEISVGQQKDIIKLKEELGNVKSSSEHNDCIRSIDILKEEINLLKKENRYIKQNPNDMEEESENESVYDSDSQNVVKNVKNKFVCEMCNFFCS